MLKFRFFALAAIGICLIQSNARYAGSCSVPVFRYALERWKPDPYKGIFIYRGEIAQKDQALLEQLKQAAENAECPLNLWLHEVNLASFSEKKLRELLKGKVPERLPALAIWYPDQMGKKPPLWIVELTPAVVKALTDSPKRRNLAESLLNGQSIVWIFIPSGNSQKDERARALIKQELDSALIAAAEMPFFILSGSKKQKLTYGFPILTLSRTDPAERFLLDMLLNSESDLYEHQDEPMVFPVFGRGRLLGCLFGEYISVDRIRGAVSFLAGSCSCQAKELNPGIDLLIAAPWDMIVTESFVDDATLPELTGVMPGPANPVEQPAIAANKVKKNTGILATYGITLGSVALVVVFAGLILSHRRKRD